MIIGVVISALYAFVVIVCFIGFLRFKSAPSCKKSGTLPVYVVISLYNEEDRVESLVAALRRQSFNDFTAILIDDGSTDGTYSKIARFTDGLAGFKVISKPNAGKDAAIRALLDGTLGVDIEQGLLLVTDADCTLPDGWVESMVAEACSTDASMVIGPVRIASDHPLQATEFLSVQGITIGSANMGHPLVCGGANLAFSAEAYRRVRTSMAEGTTCGGDMFLLEAMKKAGERIVVANAAAAMVVTEGKSSFKEFIKQRGRWSGKSGKYTDKEIITTAAIVFTMQCLLIISLLYALINPASLWFWIVKFLVDLPLLAAVAVRFGTPKLIAYIPLVSILYPFYVLCVIFF